MSDTPQEIYEEFTKIDNLITGLRDRLIEMPQFSEKQIDDYVIPQMRRLRWAVGDVSTTIISHLTVGQIKKEIASWE